MQNTAEYLQTQTPLLQVPADGFDEDPQEPPSSAAQVEDEDGREDLEPRQAQQQPQHKEQSNATRQTHHPAGREGEQTHVFT